MSELFVSVDIEADGRIPGVSSMLSFGSAAFTIEKQLVACFERNIEALPEAQPDAEVMAWWQGQPEAWDACRRDPVGPSKAMSDYVDHLGELAKDFGKPVFMAYPVAYDFGWMNWYLRRFTGQNPFGISGLCLKSFAAALLKLEFRQATKRRFPQRWFDPLPHTHVALVDAIGQGALGINMIREARGLPSITNIENASGFDLSTV